MSRHFILPCEALRPYVDRYWSWTTASSGAPLPFMLPGTGAELMFPYGREARLFCIRSQTFRFGGSWGEGLFSVRIRSGAMRHFSRIPLEEFFDRPVPLEDIWGGAGRGLDERVGLARDDAERASILDRWLLACLRENARQSQEIELAIWHLYYGHQTIRIEALAERLGMSRRHFERLFRLHLGMTPKAFQRTARFHLTVRDMLLANRPSGLDAALDHGYYDQSHFIREFESFVGVSPLRFFTDATSKAHFYNPPLFSPDTVPLPR